MKILANMALSLLSVVLFFGGLELCCRYLSTPTGTFKAKMPEAFKGVVEYDEVYGYKLSNQSVDSSGTFKEFAGKRVSVEKDVNTFRIICVGGSTTLGVNNPMLESYPAVLQALFDVALSDCPGRVEVINAGMMGYHSWHSRLRVDSDLDSLSPDMYLLMDGLNDVVAAAAIEDIEEAVRQREVFTRLMNVKPAEKSGQFNVFGVLEKLAFFRLGKQWISEFTIRSAMEKKMEAFGFRNNLEEFVKDRQSKGIDVALLNYGWIVHGNTSVQSEVDRIPYRFSVPLYQFGRSYVSKVNSDVARKFELQLIDLQVLIDALSLQVSRIYRVFSDEMHYTPFSDYVVARHVFMNLLTNSRLTDFIGCKAVPSQDVIDQSFSSRLAWGEDYVGYGFPRGEGKPVTVVSSEMVNVESSVTECPDGWCYYKPKNIHEEGVITLRLGVDDRRGVIAYFPRIFSDSGFVNIELYSDGKWEVVSKLVKYYDDGQWSPLEARYGVSADKLAPGTVTLRIKLLGKAQVFHKDGVLFFSQPR